MKKSISKLILVTLCVLFFSTQCDDELPPVTKEFQLEELNSLKTEIENLSSTSICGDTFECKFIAFGSKPCGGPWSYLLYSTSINTERLENLVEEFNEKEANFNKKWGIASDCSFVTPPSSVACENKTCIPVY